MNGKKSSKKYSSGRRRKVQVTKAAFKGLHRFVFFTAESLPVLKHNRVSEVFKGFKVHDFVHYSQRNYVLKWEFKEARNSFYGLGVYLLKSKFRIEGKLRFL